MTRVSHRLSNSFDGALAGGGDPASSPLYVFGPFLKLIVLAGVAPVTFGASVWLVVLTVAVVSAMYRLVMVWVTDGSGGSGLSEEEFGGWAMKVNAAITVIEYTLTFLVSVAAQVTFIADRYTFLDGSILGLPFRTIVAIALSVVIGWLVNRGPKMAAKSFGPATLAVLCLLWAMVIASVAKLGFHLPPIHLNAFRGEYLHFTLSGYAHILALMTGIEVFANLVAAYDGTAQQRSRKAFGSLGIIMGTTLVTMVIVGPAILQLSDPSNDRISVFTQTMDKLLPRPLPYLGTLVGVVVLASAAAASAQGLQNLALGLRYRNYIPAFLGHRNRHEVADRPVWLEVGVVSICYLAFGTNDETYLTLYAAGVFVLLSMTGWASTKRLVRTMRERSLKHGATIAGAIVAALLTTTASAIIFVERFFEGVWAYLLFIPALYAAFSYIRSRLGAPTALDDHLGRFYAGQYLLPFQRQGRPQDDINFRNITVVLDGSAEAEHSLTIAQVLSRTFGSAMRLAVESDSKATEGYLPRLAWHLQHLGIPSRIAREPSAATSDGLSGIQDADLIVLTTEATSAIQRWFREGLEPAAVQQSVTPLLIVRPTRDWRSRWTQFQRLLVCLDGSEPAEILPYVRVLARRFTAKIMVLGIPEAEGEAAKLEDYLSTVVAALRDLELNAHVSMAGSEPAITIAEIAVEHDVDLIVMATSGRGGAGRRSALGSVTEEVMQVTPCPLLIIPQEIAPPMPEEAQEP